MAIKIQGSTIIDDSRNIVNAGVTTTTILNVGVGGTILYTTESGFVGMGTNTTLQISGNVAGVGFESYELDEFINPNGLENTFVPTFNYERVFISNPYKLMVTIDNILQSAFLNNASVVFQSHFLGSNKGYTIDYDNNIKFSNSISNRSQVVVRVLPISNTFTKIKTPRTFKPADILLGY